MRTAPDLSAANALPQHFPLLERATVVVVGLLSTLVIAFVLFLSAHHRETWHLLLALLLGGLVVFALNELWRLRLTVAADELRLEGWFLRHRAAITDVHADMMGYAENDLLMRWGLGLPKGFQIPGFAYHVFTEPGPRKVVLIRTSERLLKIPTREFDLVIGIHDAPRVIAAVHAAVAAARRG